MAQPRLDDPAAQLVWADYVGAIQAPVIRRDGLERAIDALVPRSLWAQSVARLRWLRGVSRQDLGDEPRIRYQMIATNHRPQERDLKLCRTGGQTPGGKAAGHGPLTARGLSLRDLASASRRLLGLRG